MHGRSCRQPRTSSRTPPQGQGSLRPCSELAFFLRTPIPKCGRLPHRSTQASLAAVLRVRRAAFFLSSLFGSYFLFMVAGEVPAVPEQQLRLPHRSRQQNEVPRSQVAGSTHIPEPPWHLPFCNSLRSARPLWKSVVSLSRSCPSFVDHRVLIQSPATAD